MCVPQVIFRGLKTQVHDDTVVKTWYLDGDNGGVETAIYGVIKRVFTHCLYPGGNRDVVLECEWLETVPDEDQADDVYLPQVKFNPESNLNRRARLVFLRQRAS